jgi:hypothetical protein
MRGVILNKNINNTSSSNIEKVFISMPYYGELSMTLANKIKNLLKDNKKRIIFGFKAGSCISSIFRRTYCGSDVSMNVIYKYNSKDCEGCYIGETCRGAKKTKRWTQKALHGIGFSRIADHCLKFKHENDWNEEIIAMESNETKRKMKESLLMDLFKKKGKNVYSQKSFQLNIF